MTSTPSVEPPPPPRRIVASLFNALLVIAYPVAMLLGLRHLGPRPTGLVVAGFVVAGALLKLPGRPREELWPILRLPLALVVLIACGIALDDPRFVLALPVLISLVMGIAFAASLRGPMSMVERFARLQDPDLSEAKVRYCRCWTVVWCVFFAINGALSAILALWAPVELWTLYTGFVAYLLVGTLFTIERILRRARFGV